MHIDTSKLTAWEVHALTTFTLDMLTREQHIELSRQLPLIYNRLFGREVMRPTNIGLYPDVQSLK